MNQNCLTPNELQECDTAIELPNFWTFLDGLVCLICRLGENQRLVSNGHKQVGALKFQIVVAPDILIANLYEPVVGRGHDCAILNTSGLLQL